MFSHWSHECIHDHSTQDEGEPMMPLKIKTRQRDWITKSLCPQQPTAKWGEDRSMYFTVLINETRALTWTVICPRGCSQRLCRTVPLCLRHDILQICSSGRWFAVSLLLSMNQFFRGPHTATKAAEFICQRAMIRKSKNVQNTADSLQHSDYCSICTWPVRSGSYYFSYLSPVISIHQGALWEISPRL